MGERAGRNLGCAIRHGAGPFHTHTNTASRVLASGLSTRAMVAGWPQVQNRRARLETNQGVGNKELGRRVHIRGKSRRDVVVRIFFLLRVELVLVRKKDSRLIAPPSVTSLVETALAAAIFVRAFQRARPSGLYLLGFPPIPNCANLLCL